MNDFLVRETQTLEVTLRTKMQSVYYIREDHPGKRFAAHPLFEANLKTGEIIAYEAVNNIKQRSQKKATSTNRA